MNREAKRSGTSRKRWLIRLGAAVGGLAAFVLGLGGLLVWCLNFFPDSVMTAEVTCRGQAETLEPGQRFKLLNWNIQYGAGRNYHFFYDGGSAVQVRRSDVTRTMDAVAKLLRKEAPHIVLLQEVDRDSARTHRVDQLKRISSLGHWKCWTSTPYHRSRYVPVPMGNPMGRVDMHLAAFSRFKMDRAKRRALPMLKENFVRRAFNLKRAILEAAVPIKGRKQPLMLLNVHLSAFSFGDGTLDRQTDLIIKRLEALDKSKTPWILAGDFNMIPPGTDPASFGKERRYYADSKNPIQRLYAKARPALPLDIYRKSKERYYTYLPFKSSDPNRMIDYIFVSKGVEVHDFRVIGRAEPCSDHLPLVLEASVK